MKGTSKSTGKSTRKSAGKSTRKSAGKSTSKSTGKATKRTTGKSTSKNTSKNSRTARIFAIVVVAIAIVLAALLLADPEYSPDFYPPTETPGQVFPATTAPELLPPTETPGQVLPPTAAPGDTPEGQPPTDEPGEVSPPVGSTPGIPLASLLTPFDANLNDLGGPSTWFTREGKTPEIILASDGVSLDVLAQDYDPRTAWNAVLLHVAPSGSGYQITQALTDLPMLDRVMGLAIDEAGNRYYATGVAEGDRVDHEYPPPGTPRSDIVRVVKLDAAGSVLFNVDLDTARHAYDSSAERIINPMVGATSRLAVGGNRLALVHGINTDPDWNIGGARHQKALSTRLDATTGAIVRTSSVWVSHSFDQRLLYDGVGIVEYHLGDSYPRYVVLGRNHKDYPLFYIKGTLGDNNTHTRLGNLALIEGDPEYRYLALFATESSRGTGSTIEGPRNLAIVRVRGSDNGLDPGLPDELTVVSDGTQVTNRLRWLTRYTAKSNLHAERPKLVGIGGDQYIVLWEQWLHTGARADTFQGVYGMLIDAMGKILREATLLTGDHHLHRGDDAILLDGRAGWMTGSAAGQKLYLHLVDASLHYERVTLD